MKQCRVTILPMGLEINVPEGTTIKDAISKAMPDFDYACGGRGNCGKCRVKVVSNAPLPTDNERRLLEEQELEAGIRLACIAAIHENITVQLPEGKKAEHNILMQAIERSFTIEPLISKHCLELECPSLQDQRSDWKRIKESLAKEKHSYIDLRIQLPVLHNLSKILRSAQYYIAAVTDGEEILGIEKPDEAGMMLGMAFDIGTTTIVGYVMDLETGRELCAVSALNPQVKFGADVITRTGFTNQEGGLEKLQSVLINKIDQLIGEAAEKAGINRKQIYALTFVGNTCMHHILLGISPKYLALSPYVPVTIEPVVFDPGNFNISINPAGRAFVLPNIAGFVGADTVAVVLATEMDKSTDIKLAIDIGTNGEMVLGSSRRLVSCSTAAGPAFEGAQISCGMRGAEGAIDHVGFEGKLTYSVIGGGKPKGICGSALLDTIAGLVELGIINKRGKLLPPERIKNPAAEAFVRNIIQHGDTYAFLLADMPVTAHGRRIMITQEDINALQLAKGAIAAGIKVLMQELGICEHDISEVLLAGAFGNYMDPHSSCVIGLIPGELESKIKMVGNAAGTGAKLALLSRSEFRRAADIADSVEYVELGAYPKFNSVFAAEMCFKNAIGV